MISDARVLTAQQFAHNAHGSIHVVEERHVARTQVVQAGLTVGRQDEAVARTLAVAGKTHRALAQQ